MLGLDAPLVGADLVDDPGPGQMRSMRTVLILRSVLAVLVATFAVVSFTDGRVVIGVLLSAFALTNVALIVTISTRQRDLRRRFPGLAGQRGADS